MVPSPRPRRLVLLGHPVAHSLSPRLQNAALRAAGLELRYEALDVPPHALEARLRALHSHDAAGNVTIPHKAAVLRSCGWTSQDARMAGAVNTFWWHEGTLCGDNTDAAGFDEAARALLGAGETPPPDARVVLLGAGGAAGAVLLALSRWRGARVRLVNRTPARAEHLAARFPHLAEVSGSLAEALGEDTTLVVNATPAGMADVVQPVPVADLPRTAAVLDLVYREGETAWVRAARARGLRAADGLGMLVGQGALAFERWLGFPPDRRAMWEAAGRAAPD